MSAQGTITYRINKDRNLNDATTRFEDYADGSVIPHWRIYSAQPPPQPRL